MWNVGNLDGKKQEKPWRSLDEYNSGVQMG
jgi:hypothetical protein